MRLKDSFRQLIYIRDDLAHDVGFSVERIKILNEKHTFHIIQIRKVPILNRIWNGKVEIIAVSIFRTVDSAFVAVCHLLLLWLNTSHK